MAVSGQVYAALSHARQVRELTDLVGESGLAEGDRDYLRFADALETGFVNQGRSEGRTIEDSLERAWTALTLLPVGDLSRLDPDDLARHLASQPRASVAAP
jgi:V/A-type H+-transporting ATPase subunit B